MDRLRATLLLLLAAVLWGTAFAFQTQASVSIGSFSFVAGKSLVGALFLAAIIGIRQAAARPKSAGQQAIEGLRDNAARSVIVGGIVCGIALFCADNLQQAGITAYPSDAAASGRSGFLTATYVVMVALVSPFLGRRLHPAVPVAVAVCVGGLYLLCLAGGLEGMYVGDMLCLGGAAFYTVHILVIDRYARVDALRLTLVQFITSAVLSVTAAALFEHPTPAAFASALVPILYVGIFSTGLGYTLQALGQRHADPAVAAIVMSLESVFAALAGWVLLGEVLATRELAGCLLMFAAVLLAQVPDIVDGLRRRNVRRG